ncbi:glycosyltransferase involved in cell wall biosynthesis [Salinibacter ruber]|uniref:glycosyltransferase family 2 protein n=1 Tax=Salinibacter ruber TaxID=146919 RepID=UPI00245074A8|nr:glycosyltransferase involved in cell wall biosynthesis [Salinibacter ruber]MCS4143818.1 glycosyltransferase involved in cell wall biosynthesis [Salinibacter ruber]
MKNESSDEGAKVSVVIPVYNMAEYVGESIRSALNAGLESVEVIVIDDGSTDGTRSVVKTYTDQSSPRYDGRVHYEYQANRGKSAAVNRGLETASGSYLAMLDADDRIPPSGLSSRFETRFNECGRPCDLVIGGFGVFGPDGRDGSRAAPSIKDSRRLHDRFYLSLRTPFHLNACLISRSLVNKVGTLDESLHRCIDGDYALRVLREADSVNTADAIVYLYRKHRTSAIERAKYRLKTARYRPKVVWKNYEGWRRWVAIPFGLAMDTGKFFYELVNSYKA